MRAKQHTLSTTRNGSSNRFPHVFSVCSPVGVMAGFPALVSCTGFSIHLPHDVLSVLFAFCFCLRVYPESVIDPLGFLYRGLRSPLASLVFPCLVSLPLVAFHHVRFRFFFVRSNTQSTCDVFFLSSWFFVFGFPFPLCGKWGRNVVNLKVYSTFPRY